MVFFLLSDTKTNACLGGTGRYRLDSRETEHGNGHTGRMARVGGPVSSVSLAFLMFTTRIYLAWRKRYDDVTHVGVLARGSGQGGRGGYGI